MKIKFSSIVISTALIFASCVTYASTSQAAAEVKTGAACAKFNSTIKVGIITYKCVLVGGKRQWGPNGSRTGQFAQYKAVLQSNGYSM